MNPTSPNPDDPTAGGQHETVVLTDQGPRRLVTDQPMTAAQIAAVQAQAGRKVLGVLAGGVQPSPPPSPEPAAPSPAFQGPDATTSTTTVQTGGKPPTSTEEFPDLLGQGMTVNARGQTVTPNPPVADQRGFLSRLPAMGGATAGAIGGARVGAMAPYPASLITAPAGAVLGAGLGAFGGEAAQTKGEELFGTQRSAPGTAVERGLTAGKNAMLTQGLFEGAGGLAQGLSVGMRKQIDALAQPTAKLVDTVLGHLGSLSSASQAVSAASRTAINQTRTEWTQLAQQDQRAFIQELKAAPDVAVDLGTMGGLVDTAKGHVGKLGLSEANRNALRGILDDLGAETARAGSADVVPYRDALLTERKLEEFMRPIQAETGPSYAATVLNELRDGIGSILTKAVRGTPAEGVRAARMAFAKEQVEPFAMTLADRLTAQAASPASVTALFRAPDELAQVMATASPASTAALQRAWWTTASEGGPKGVVAAWKALTPDGQTALFGPIKDDMAQLVGELAQHTATPLGRAAGFLKSGTGLATGVGGAGLGTLFGHGIGGAAAGAGIGAANQLLPDLAAHMVTSPQGARLLAQLVKHQAALKTGLRTLGTAAAQTYGQGGTGFGYDYNPPAR